jgi:DNA-binding transcriptional MerR regulator
VVRAAPLGPAHRLGLDAVATRSGLHPDLVRRFVTLGLVDATRDAAGRLWFEPSAPATLARIQRLRAALPLNYASLGLVLDLLDRISELEDALRRSNAGSRSDESWI